MSWYASIWRAVFPNYNLTPKPANVIYLAGFITRSFPVYFMIWFPVNQQVWKNIKSNSGYYNS
jgi:hypothetical protein